MLQDNHDLVVFTPYLIHDTGLKTVCTYSTDVSTFLLQVQRWVTAVLFITPYINYNLVITNLYGKAIISLSQLITMLIRGRGTNFWMGNCTFGELP